VRGHPTLSRQGSAKGSQCSFRSGLLQLKDVFGLSDEGMCERGVYNPYSSNSPGMSSRWNAIRRRPATQRPGGNAAKVILFADGYNFRRILA
jgi:hypothetical protein